MSFALTERQLVDGSKDVTRRLGWRTVKPGDLIRAVRKAMGLKRGEKHFVLGSIRVVAVSREILSLISHDEVRREGFPGETPTGFIGMFCRANGCSPSAEVTRIEFVFSPPDTAGTESHDPDQSARAQ